MVSKPKLLCVGGMHGHGHYALRSIMDGHPEIVAYPFFLANLFRYWRYGNLSKLAPGLLVEAVWPLVNNDPIFEANIGVKKSDLGFNDSEVLAELVRLAEAWPKDQPVRLATLIYTLIEAFHSTCSVNKNTHPMYYAFEVDCREFPWSDSDFNSQVIHLFSFRDRFRSYLSHRADFLDRYGWSLAKFLFTRAPLEVSQLIYNWNVLRCHFKDPNFILFNFEMMRSHPDEYMRTIASRLQIEYMPSLIELSRNGLPEFGFTTDGQKLNRIAPSGGNYVIPLTTAEEMVLEIVPVFDVFGGGETEARHNPNYPGIGGFVVKALSCVAQLPDFVLSCFVKIQFSNHVFTNRFQFIRFCKSQKTPTLKITEIGIQFGKLPVWQVWPLRVLTYFGYLYLYCFVRVLGGRVLLWPYLIIFIKLNVYHHFELLYKRQVADKRLRYECV